MDAPTSTGRWAAPAGLACALALVLLVGLSGGRDLEPAPAPAPAVASSPSAPAPATPAGASDAATQAPASPGARACVLVVLGPGDRPLRGVRVRRSFQPGEWTETDGAGRATVSFPPGASDTTVWLSGPVPGTRVTPDGPETVVRFPDLLPLSVLLVDGETGEWVGGAGVLLWAISGPLELDAHGARFEMPVSPARPGQVVELAFRVESPLGYAGPEAEWFRARGTVSVFAARVEVTIPVYREAALFARVEEADGTPAAGAEIHQVKLGETAVAFRADPVGADGRTRIRGVPALRGEPVTVRAGKDRRNATSLVVRLAPSGQPVQVLVRLPEEAPSRGTRGGIVLGSASTSFVDILVGALTGTGRLEIRVLRRDGAPAAGAHLRSTIAVGTSATSTLPDATVTVRVREPGYLAPPPATVRVRDGESARLEIREADGTDTTVLVLDEDGRALPFARIEVEDRDGVAWVKLEGVVQQLVILTDREGRALLPDLPAGTSVVTARFGSRSVSGETTPGTALTLRLPR